MDELVITTGYVDIGLDHDFDFQRPPKERQVKPLCNLTPHEVFILMHSFENLPPAYLDFFSRDNISGNELAKINSMSDFLKLGINLSRDWELNMFAFVTNLRNHGVPVEKLESCQSIPLSEQGTIQDSISALKEAMKSRNDTYLIEKAFDVICHTIQDNKTLQKIFGQVYKIESNLIKLSKICLPSFVLCSKICKTIHLFSFENDVNTAKIGTAGACELISSILKTHINIEVIRETAATAIRSLSYNSPENTKKLQQSGCVEHIVTALHLSTESAIVSKMICFGIRNLAFDSDIRKQLGEFGVCDALSKAVTFGFGDPHFVEAAALAIFNLSFSEANRQRIFQGCGSLILSCLTLHMSVPETVAAVCRALYIFAHKDKSACAAMREVGVTAAVITAVVSYQESHAVVEWGLKAFVNLCGDGDDDLQPGSYSGLSECLVNILQAHESNVGILVVTCRTTCRLATGSVDNITALCQANICSVLLGFLSKHVTELTVCEWCSRALFELCSHSENCRLQVISLDYGSILMNAIQVQMQSPAVLEPSCKLLCALTKYSTDDAVVAALAVLGACELVVLALWSHLSKPEVIQSAGDTVTALAAGSDVNSASLSSLGVCDALLFGVRVNKSSSSVVKSACDAMYALIHHSLTSTVAVRNSQLLFDSGLCECLVAIMRIHVDCRPVLLSILRVAHEFIGSNVEHGVRLQSLQMSRLVIYSMRHHKDDVKLVVAACNVIRIISQSEAHCAALLECEVCGALVSVLENLSSTAAGAEALCATIFNLATSDISRQKLGETGMCEVVVGYFQSYSFSEEAATNACKAVCMLSAKCPANTARLGKCGAVDRVVGALDRHPTLPGLVEWSLKALSNLCLDHQANADSACSPTALATVTSVVMTHLQVVGIAEWLCRLVSYLGDLAPKYREAMGSAGFCDLVIAVLQVHSSMFNISGWCMRAICALAVDSEANMKALRIANAFELCVRVLRLHGAVTGAVEWTTQAVLVLGVNATNYRFALLPPDTVVTLSSLYRSHLGNANILTLLCKVIRRLSDDAKTCTQFGDLGLCESAILSLLTHMSALAVVERILLVVGVLANVESNRTRLGAAGACETITQTLKLHSRESAIVLSSCRIITKLSQSSAENRDRFIYAQAKKLVCDLVSSTELGEQVRSEAREALRML